MPSASQKSNFRETALVAGIMLLLVHLFYFRTMEAGFVTDFTGLQERIDGASFWGFLDCFGFPAMHQVTNFFLYLFYDFFGQNPLPWHLVHTSMHVLNGVLGYHLGKRIFQNMGIGSPRLGAFVGSLLFLLSPYAAEVVIWRVCFNFLMSTACILGSLLFLLRYFENKKTSSLWWSHGLFALGLFTFELAVVVPFLGLVLASTIPLKSATSPPQGGTSQPEENPLKFGQSKHPSQKPKVGEHRATPSPLEGGWGLTKQYWKRWALPQFLLLTLYFILNKLLLGGWVGHYGAETHLNFDAAQISANLLKYFSKYLTLWREWPGAWKQQWMAICESETVAYGALLVGVAVVALWLRFAPNFRPGQGGESRRAISPLWGAGGAWLLFFIALLPVANLYVPWLLHGENDRYGYLASLFFYFGLVCLLSFLPKYLRYPFFAAALAVSVFHLHKITVYWQHNAEVVNGLLDDFRWEGAPEIYVLAMPENFKGTPMFKDFSRKDLILKHALKYGRGKDVKGKIYQIAQYNLGAPEDGVSVTSDSTNHFQIQFDQWGNWWWRNGIGTQGYETGKYKFTPTPRGSEVWVKDPVEGAVFIYAKGKKWESAIGPD